MEGRGLPRDYASAERWLLRAMEAGNIRAKLNLGMLYFDRGFGTNGPETGLNMIREAANAGDFRAPLPLLSGTRNERG